MSTPHGIPDIEPTGSAKREEEAAEDRLHITMTNLEIDKLNLELQKGALEKAALTRQLFWQGVALEWIKAGTVFAALMGIFATLFEGCAMGQVLHGSATTTEAVRRAIQHSQESLRALAKRHGVNPKTIAKWKSRKSVSDLPCYRSTTASTPFSPPFRI
jgi:hypothetical protein